MSTDADVRQLAMGRRRDFAPIAANVRRFGFVEQIRHRFRRPAQIPLSGLHELQRGAVPQFPALFHRQSNGKTNQISRHRLCCSSLFLSLLLLRQEKRQRPCSSLLLIDREEKMMAPDPCQPQ